MENVSLPTKSEMRLVGIVAAPESEVSPELMRAISYAHVGWLDGPALFGHLRKQGLQPKWRPDIPAIQIDGPLGMVVLQLGEESVTLH